MSAGKGNGEWFVLKDDMPLLAEKLHRVVSQVVRKAAFDIQGKAMKGAPKDTGFLKSSIYTVTHNSSNYGNALARGVKRGHDLSQMLDEIPPADNDQTAYIAVGASYGIYQEYGTSHVPAQPYLQPAVDAVHPVFEEAMRRIEEHFKAGGLITEDSDVGDFGEMD